MIEYLLLWANVTTADIEKCTAEWMEAGAFVTKEGESSPLTFFIMQARVEAAYRFTNKRPELRRQISSASSAPDSAFGGASSAAPSSAPDPAFYAHSISDVEDGSTWGRGAPQPNESHSQRACDRAISSIHPHRDQTLSYQPMMASTARRWLK